LIKKSFRQGPPAGTTGKSCRQAQLLKIIKTGITGVGTRGAGTSEFGITETGITETGITGVHSTYLVPLEHIGLLIGEGSILQNFAALKCK
jgi:hypothetical protein